MTKRNEIIIQINFDWRILALIILIGAAMGVVYRAVRAQDDAFPQMNMNTEIEAGSLPTAVPPVLANCPAGQFSSMNGGCSDWLPQSAPAAGSAPTAGVTQDFYVTKQTYLGNQVLTACASGFHTASFWEILGISNLHYDYANPAAYTKTDSGYGPPSDWYGWVRTGLDGASLNTAGSGNCANWTTSDGSNYGSAVRLTRTWETPPSEIVPWDATSFPCNTTGPVWCVRDGR